MHARPVGLFGLLALMMVWLPVAAAAHDATHAQSAGIDDGFACVFAQLSEREEALPAAPPSLEGPLRRLESRSSVPLASVARDNRCLTGPAIRAPPSSI
ncbi:MAG: hypothetical protein V2I43_12845 [Parvularcula sp.]|nr:hypothetical protein [Parvularcula sp.]